MTEQAGAPGGRLVWGIKSSLREYVTELPDSSQVAEGGAAVLESGEYGFPLKSSQLFDSQVGTGILEFAGSIELDAYRGILNMKLSDLQIHVSPDQLVLSVSNSLGGTFRVDLARADRDATSPLELVGDVVVWNRGVLELTADGASVFDFHYPPLTKLDPISLRVKLGA